MQQLWDAMRRSGIRRPADDRWLGGVCAGTARRLGVDPVLIRVILLALTLLGGAGVVAYAIALVLLPDHDGRIELERASYGDLTGTTVGAVGLLVLAMVVPGPWDLLRGGNLVEGGDLIGAVLVGTLLLIGLALLPKLREQSERGSTGSTATPSDTVPPAGAAPGYPTGPTAYVPPPPPPVRPTGPVVVRPQRSGPGPALSAAVTGAALVVAGLAWLAAAADLVPGRPWVVGACAALVVLGLALLGLGLAGRRDGPVGGAAFVVVLVLVTALFVPRGTPLELAGDPTWRPTTAVTAERGGSLGLGDAVLDLSGLADLPDGAGVEIPVRVGIGSIDVLVPDGMDVTVRAGAVVGTARAGEGDSTAQDGGVGIERTLVRDADPQVVVDARVVVGDVRVLWTEAP
jgi:phage shock protein PspC (stress-responsive transcriptional regulator)